MSSYIRLEILLFFRAFETGVGMLVVYRLTDMLKRRLFCDRMWNSTKYPLYCSTFCDRMWNSTVDILYWLLAGLLLFTALYQCNYGRIRFFMLAGVAFGGIFANFVLNRLLFLVKRCKISSYRHTKRRLWCNRRGRRFEKVKKEKK